MAKMHLNFHTLIKNLFIEFRIVIFDVLNRRYEIGSVVDF